MISCAAQAAAGVFHHGERFGQDFVEELLLRFKRLAALGLGLVTAEFGLELADLGHSSW